MLSHDTVNKPGSVQLTMLHMKQHYSKRESYSSINLSKCGLLQHLVN